MPILYEKYRPKSFDEVIGQDKAIKKVKRVLSRGWSGQAWWISGSSGIGKTTIARIIGKQGPGNDMFTLSEFDAGFVTTKILGELVLTKTTGAFGQMVYVINEAHGLKKSIVRGFLGYLEPLPKRVVVIFTTTKIGQKNLFEDNIDAKPLLSRCIVIELTNQGLAEPFAKHCQEIAKKENLDGKKPIESYKKLAQK